ncbi:hypothetical protein Taro_034513 [Colocasia esculenta]|uniref:Uncharacterized protein n=1 Tax=Colocasia esculenta TaxID=4460 RepID=A0A843WC46_COLES|nr:hypothetical protein [Colocasia esculenta]
MRGAVASWTLRGARRRWPTDVKGPSWVRSSFEGDIGAASVLELAADRADFGAEGKMRLGSGIESFLELSCLEAGARLASRACGLRVPLLVASGGGLVAVVVTAFSSRRFLVFLTRASGGSSFGVLSVPWSRSWVPARDGTGVCGSPTWWRVHGPGWFCLWALDLVEFLLLWPVRDCLVLAGCGLWLRCIAWLPCVLCLGGSGGGSPRTSLRSSQDLPLSLLAEVLPRSALCLFRTTVVLPLQFEVFRLVGLHSGEVLPGWLLALLVEVLPKAASCCFGCRCSLSLCGDELSLFADWTVCVTVCLGIVGQGVVPLAVHLAAALASWSRCHFQVSRLR